MVEDDVAISLPSGFICEMHHQNAFFFNLAVYGPGGEGSLAQDWQGEDVRRLERIGLAFLLQPFRYYFMRMVSHLSSMSPSPSGCGQPCLSWAAGRLGHVLGFVYGAVGL